MKEIANKSGDPKLDWGPLRQLEPIHKARANKQVPLAEKSYKWLRKR